MGPEKSSVRAATTVSEAIEALRQRGEVLVPDVPLALKVRRAAETEGMPPVIISGGPGERGQVHLTLAGPDARMVPDMQPRTRPPST